MRNTRMDVRIEDALSLFKSKKAAIQFFHLLNAAAVCFNDSKIYRDEKLKLLLGFGEDSKTYLRFEWGAQIERDIEKYGE